MDSIRLVLMGPTMVFSISQLAEIAVVASSRTQFVIQSQSSLSSTHLQSLWNCCRNLSVNWYQQLNELMMSVQLRDDPSDTESANRSCALFHEIFVSEMLIRVWATALVGHGRFHLHTTAEHVARQVVSGLTSISERALSILNQDDSLPLLDAAVINRLRRKTERWTDVLIGHSGRFAKTLDFAHDPAEAADISELNLRRFARAVDEPVCLLLRASIRAAFEKVPYQTSALATELAQLILAELPESDDLGSQISAADALASPAPTRSKFRFARRNSDS